MCLRLEEKQESYKIIKQQSIYYKYQLFHYTFKPAHEKRALIT